MLITAMHLPTIAHYKIASLGRKYEVPYVAASMMRRMCDVCIKGDVCMHSVYHQ